MKRTILVSIFGKHYVFNLSDQFESAEIEITVNSKVHKILLENEKNYYVFGVDSIE